MNAHQTPGAMIAATQLAKLEALISAAKNARGETAAGILFASTAGKILTNAAFELFECDQLYRLGEDVEHELSGRRHAA